MAQSIPVLVPMVWNLPPATGTVWVIPNPLKLSVGATVSAVLAVALHFPRLTRAPWSPTSPTGMRVWESAALARSPLQPWLLGRCPRVAMSVEACQRWGGGRPPRLPPPPQQEGAPPVGLLRSISGSPTACGSSVLRLLQGSLYTIYRWTNRGTEQLSQLRESQCHRQGPDPVCATHIHASLLFWGPYNMGRTGQGLKGPNIPSGSPPSPVLRDSRRTAGHLQRKFMAHLWPAGSTTWNPHQLSSLDQSMGTAPNHPCSHRGDRIPQTHVQPEAPEQDSAAGRLHRSWSWREKGGLGPWSSLLPSYCGSLREFPGFSGHDFSMENNEAKCHRPGQRLVHAAQWWAPGFPRQRAPGVLGTQMDTNTVLCSFPKARQWVGPQLGRDRTTLTSHPCREAPQEARSSELLVTDKMSK